MTLVILVSEDGLDDVDRGEHENDSLHRVEEAGARIFQEELGISL